jgi:hypothetical protein
MDNNFYLRSMFVTPEQAVELCKLNIDQSKSMFYWGRIAYQGKECWGLFLIKSDDATPEFLCGDNTAEELNTSIPDISDYVPDLYAAFNLSQLMQILQNEVLNMSLTKEDTVDLSHCPRKYEYYELAEGFAQFLIGLIKAEQFNDDQCNGTLEIYNR